MNLIGADVIGSLSLAVCGCFLYLLSLLYLKPWSRALGKHSCIDAHRESDCSDASVSRFFATPGEEEAREIDEKAVDAQQNRLTVQVEQE